METISCIEGYGLCARGIICPETDRGNRGLVRDENVPTTGGCSFSTNGRAQRSGLVKRNVAMVLESFHFALYWVSLFERRERKQAYSSRCRGGSLLTQQNHWINRKRASRWNPRSQ
jgi:hypothetical protein